MSLLFERETLNDEDPIIWEDCHQDIISEMQERYYQECLAEEKLKENGQIK